MNKSLMNFGVWVLLACLMNGLHAQDPQFSQFYNSMLYYNPATAGLTQDLRFTSSYRNLYSSIPGDISSYFLAADYQWSARNVGLGLLLLGDNEGYNNMKYQRFELIYSYRIQTQDRLLQFGMSLISLNIRGIQNDDFVFTEQLDPIYGNIQSSSFVYDKIETKVYPDWNIGLVYKQNFYRKQRNFLTPTAGVSISHILRPNISFLNEEARLPAKFVIYANFLTRLTFNKKTSDPFGRKYAFINPGFIYEYQNPFQTFSFGTDFNWINSEDYRIRFGMWFRNQNFMSGVHKFNAVIVLAGVTIPTPFTNQFLSIDYTYDSTISKLEFASGGAHEITLTYSISLAANNCPDPNRFREPWRAAMGMEQR